MLLMKSWCGKMSLRVGMASATVFGLLLLAACGGDSGTSASSDNGTSSSEEIQSSSCCQMRSSSSLKTVSSSSSSKVESSSSVILSGDGHEESSSSSSTSLKSVSSSSNRSSSSSSSEMAKSSSSSKGEAKLSSSNQSSSSSEKKDDGWDWDMPKEAYLNPEIDYGSMTDPRDGQIYKTVKIGNQVWMAENLNYADSVKTPSLLEHSWCYNDKAEYCAVTGRLYNWAAAIDSVKLATDADNPQDCGFGHRFRCTLPDTVYGICPPGWHLPTKTEWETLFTEVGGQSTAGKVFKSQKGWYNKGIGTDAYGFSALPAGDWFFLRKFDSCVLSTNFWSATQDDGDCDDCAYNMHLSYDNENAGLFVSSPHFGYSVRCLKNEP